MADAEQGSGSTSTRIVLSGERADHGIGLAVLGRVLGALSDSLRSYARATRGEQPRRLGATSAADEAATDLRLVGLEEGSVVLIVEAPPTDPDTTIPAEHIAIATVDGFMGAVEDGSLPVDALDALDRSLAPLGPGASIALKRQSRTVAIDRERIETLRVETAPAAETDVRIVGRMRALDLDRTKIGIRTPDGMLWACLYPDDMANLIVEGINRVVIASGRGVVVSPGKGRVRIRDLQVVAEDVQTSLFDRIPRSIPELMDAQHVHKRGHLADLTPSDATDKEVEAFLNALRTM